VIKHENYKINTDKKRKQKLMQYASYKKYHARVSEREKLIVFMQSELIQHTMQFSLDEQ